jgi:NaMN:DMB phosphoribosyltransferase
VLVLILLEQPDIEEAQELQQRVQLVPLERPGSQDPLVALQKLGQLDMLVVQGATGIQAVQELLVIEAVLRQLLV